MKNCPLCEKEIFSELEKSCKMCGMPIENIKDDFCSEECENIFINIKKLTI